MPTARTALTLAALVLTPGLVACDDKSGDTGSATQVAATEGTDGQSTDDPTTEGATEGATEGTTEGATEGATDSTAGATEDSSTTWDHVPEGTECTAELFRRTRACEGGVQFCATDYGTPEATYFWGPCVTEPMCIPGAQDGCLECDVGPDGVPTWFDFCEDDTGTTTPLVLNFGEGPVRYASSAASFDLGPACGATDWPAAATPWLAFDRDGSGAIEAGRELFGSATVLRGGQLADNGFTALAELDQDRDGRISASDPAFARLLLWADHDGDRRSTGWELTPVSAAGIVAIGLTYRNDARCDARSNCEIERAAFTYRDGLGRERIGEVIDVHLACQ